MALKPVFHSPIISKGYLWSVEGCCDAAANVRKSCTTDHHQGPRVNSGVGLKVQTLGRAASVKFSRFHLDALPTTQVCRRPVCCPRHPRLPHLPLLHHLQLPQCDRKREKSVLQSLQFAERNQRGQRHRPQPLQTAQLTFFGITARNLNIDIFDPGGVHFHYPDPIYRSQLAEKHFQNHFFTTYYPNKNVQKCNENFP